MISNFWSKAQSIYSYFQNASKPLIDKEVFFSKRYPKNVSYAIKTLEGEENPQRIEKKREILCLRIVRKQKNELKKYLKDRPELALKLVKAIYENESNWLETIPEPYPRRSYAGKRVFLEKLFGLISEIEGAKERREIFLNFLLSSCADGDIDQDALLGKLFQRHLEKFISDSAEPIEKEIDFILNRAMQKGNFRQVDILARKYPQLIKKRNLVNSFKKNRGWNM